MIINYILKVCCPLVVLPPAVLQADHPQALGRGLTRLVISQCDPIPLDIYPFEPLKAGLGSQSRSRSEPDVFGSLEPELLEEKKPGAGAAWKKSQELEPLEKKYQKQEPESLGKKIRSRSRLKKNQEPEPELLKN